MLTYLKTRQEHVRFVKPIEAQISDKLVLLMPDVYNAIETTMCLSGFVGSRCIGMAGVVDQGDGVAAAWALLSRSAGPYMLPISRKVRRVLKAYPARRIEAWTVKGNEDGHRWIRLLGFQLEEPDTVDAAGRPASRYVFGGGVS